MRIEIENRAVHKSEDKTSSNRHEKALNTSEIGSKMSGKGLELPEMVLNVSGCGQLTDEMRETLGEYALSLYGVSGMVKRELHWAG